MRRLLVGLTVGMTLATACGALGDEAPPQKMTPQEREKLKSKWNELSVAGVRHYQAKRLAEAAERLKKALDIARQLYPKQDHPDVAHSLSNLAFAVTATGNYRDAESLFREVLEMRRRLYPKQDHPSLAVCLFMLAAVHMGQQKHAEAERFFRDALAMRRRLHGEQAHPDFAECLNGLARALQEQGKLTEADPLHREALAMRRRLYRNQDHPNLALSLNNVARVLQDQGKYAEAETLYREAMEMNRRLHHYTLFINLHNLSHMLLARKKYAEAETLSREALEICLRNSPKQGDPYVVDALNNVGYLLMAQEKYKEAETFLRRALEMSRRLFPRQDHIFLADSLNYLAFVRRFQGKYVEAEKLGREALAMNRRLSPKDRGGLARSLLYMAELLEDQGSYTEAEAFNRESLDKRRRLYPNQDHPEILRLLITLGKLSLRSAKHEKADLLFRDALKIDREMSATIAMVRSEGEALALVSSQTQLLSGFLSNARAMKAGPAVVYPELWTSKAVISRVYERRAMAARAAAKDPKAAALLDKLTHYRRRRADLLMAATPSDPVTRKQRDLDIAQYTTEIEKLDRAIRPLLPAVERAYNLAKATSADFQKVIPADAAVVDFIRYTMIEQDPKKPGVEGWKSTERYTAFVVTKDKASWLDLGPAEDIEYAVTAWRDGIKLGKDIPPEIPVKIRELVWEKVRKGFPNKVKVVYVSPDQALCRVPWAALPGDKPKTILLEDYAVAVIPHAAFLLDKLWPHEALPQQPTGVLAVGGVAYDSDPPTHRVALNRGDALLKPGQRLKWAALDNAAVEVTGVTSAAAKKKLEFQTLSRDKATVDAVLTALPKARYAHLATHGFFADPSFRSVFQVDPKLFQMTPRGERIGAAALSPLVMTGLVFAGANKPNTPGRGIVTGEALVDLNLSGLDLAVLSACETGLGDVAGGEGTFSLQRAFHLAGTRDVVASLWKVNDRATAALMAEFYRNLWEKNKPPVIALQLAQLEIYRHPDRIPKLAANFRGDLEVVPGGDEQILKPSPDGKAHPRFWAAFTLSGPGR